MLTSETRQLACQEDAGRVATTREQYAQRLANVEANAEVVAQAIVQTAVSHALLTDPACRRYDTHTRLIIAARSAERHVERARTRVVGRRPRTATEAVLADGWSAHYLEGDR